MDKGPHQKNWCGTVNNYSEVDFDMLKGLFASGVASYVVIGREVGQSGTPHLQVFVQFVTKKRLIGVRKVTRVEGHWESMRGTANEASSYCKKDGVFEELGQLISERQRTDLESALTEHATLTEFRDAEPRLFCQYRNGLRDIYEARASQSFVKRAPVVIWLAGETGCGKTYLATSGYQGTCYVASLLPWFDGYKQEDVVVLDDLRQKTFSFNVLLQLLGCGQCQVPVKGGSVPWNPEYIIVTCPRLPREEFTQRTMESGPLGYRCVGTEAFEDVGQLVRRCRQLFEFQLVAGEWVMFDVTAREKASIVVGRYAPVGTLWEQVRGFACGADQTADQGNEQ